MKFQVPHAMDLLQSGCILFSRSSNEYWVGWGKCLRQSHPGLNRAEDGLSLYVPDFFLKDPMPWRVFAHSCKLTSLELISLLSSSISEEPSEEPLEKISETITWEAAEFEEFQSAFEDLQRRFKAGTLRKAVPIVLEEGMFQGNSDSILKYRGLLLLRLLRSAQNFPLHLYGFWDEKEGILGATPEILFEQIEPGLLQTVAIAGTRNRVVDRELSLNLLDDPKEMEEHRIVIEGIRSSLAGLGEVKVGSTREVELPTLVHLLTPVTLVSAQEFKFEESVRRLHPTPALGAFPKGEGQVWLENSPLNQRLNQKRKRFGAPFGGIWASGQSLCLVAIRNIQWQGKSFMIGAGCGVVSASQLGRECEELRAKIRSVKKSFGIL